MPIIPFLANLPQYRQRLLTPGMKGRTFVCAVYKANDVTGLHSQLTQDVEDSLHAEQEIRHLQDQLQAQRDYVMQLISVNKAAEDEHRVMVDQLKEELMEKEQEAALASRHAATMAEQASKCHEQVGCMERKHAQDLHSLQELHEQALAAQASAAQQRAEQLTSNLRQEAANNAAKTQEEHKVIVEQLKSMQLEKEQEAASRHAAAIAEQAQGFREQIASMESRHAQHVNELKAQGDKAMAAQTSATEQAKQELQQLQGKLSQESATHAASTKELQLQLDSSHHSKEAAVAELQTQLANHKAVREELSKAQAERDSARQAAAKFEDLYVNATTEFEKVTTFIKSLIRPYNLRAEAWAHGDVYGLARLRHVLHWAVFIAKSTLRQLQAEGQVAAYAEIARMRAAAVRENTSAAARSQAAADVARLQGLIADLALPASDAKSAQDTEALHPKNALLGGSAPTPYPDQGSQSLTTESIDHPSAAQSTTPAALEVREVVSQAASQPADVADDGNQEAAPPSPANTVPDSGQPKKAKKGKKGKAGRQALAASSAPASVTQAASLDKEDGSLGPQSQATGGVARAQDLAADLSRPSFEDAPSAAPAQATVGKKSKTGQQAGWLEISASSTSAAAPASVTKAVFVPGAPHLAADLALQSSALLEQAVGGLVVPEAGGVFPASSTPPPAQDAALFPVVAPPTGPQQLASSWWSSHVKGLQRLAGLGKKQVTGKAVLVAVPNAPGYYWPADPALRKIGSGGQGTVHYAEKWSVDSSNGRVKRRPAALKVVPCATQQQAALLDREAANLRAMQQQTQEGRQVTVPYAPALLDVVRQTEGGQGVLAMSLVEGEVLDDYISMALEKETPKQFVETVALVLKKLLQVLADLHSTHGRSFGDLKPENILMAGGKQLVLVDWCSSRDATQEAVEGAPYTLGYPSPEVTAMGHSQQPSGPLDLHKGDVWAVGVMGLLWLSKGLEMPFGPTRHQAETLASPEGLAKARKGVIEQHDAWAKAHPGNSGTTRPTKQSKMLERVTDPAIRQQAMELFLAVLNPDPAQRVTAAEALELAFLR
ncbi:hypothetical protein ABBQ38_012513 [Trebouxia sp. C0009 RCD-2024]